MFDTLRESHEEKVQKMSIYDKAELPERRNEEAYKRFRKKPYYLEDKKGGSNKAWKSTGWMR